MARYSKGPRVYLRGNVWWVSWSDGENGKVRHPLLDNFQQPFKKGAQNAEINDAAARAYSEWFRTLKAPQTQEKRTNITIGELTSNYVGAHADGWSQKTSDAYMRYMNLAETYFGKEALIVSISTDSGEAFKLWLKDYGGRNNSPLASRSVNNALEFVRTLFNYAMRLEWITRNPFLYVKLLTNVPVRQAEPFSPVETKQILETAKTTPEFQWFYPIVLCAAVTSTRRGPLPQLLCKDYDSSTKTLFLRGEISKQHKAHSYAVPNILAIELDRLVAGRDPGEFLFIDPQNKPLNIKAFDTPDKGKEKEQKSRVWYQLLLKAKVRYRGIHNLRRAAVTNLAKAQVTMEMITGVTGQTVEVARDHYLTIDRESQRRTMEKLASLYMDEKPQDTEESQVTLTPPLPIPTNPDLITLYLTQEEGRALADLLGMFRELEAEFGHNSGTIGQSQITSFVISMAEKNWRRGGDSNPRYGFTP